MKKYILLFTLAFAVAGVTNGQATEVKTTDAKVETTQKVESTPKVTAAETEASAKVAKAPACKEKAQSCCKNKQGNAQASTEKAEDKTACCSNMAEAKDGKACCDKMADKVKADKKKETKKS